MGATNKLALTGSMTSLATESMLEPPPLSVAFRWNIQSHIALAFTLLASLLCSNMQRSLAQPAPSYECAKANGIVAVALCINPKLAALDQLLGKTYRERVNRAEEAERAATRDDQRAWIKSRNARCAPSTNFQLLVNCLSQSILERLTALGEPSISDEIDSLTARDTLKPGFFQLTICNNVQRVAAISIAHRESAESGRYVIVGWYRVAPNSCEMVGSFPQGNFYYYAQSGGLNWAGSHPVCTERGNFARLDEPSSACSDDRMKQFSEAAVDEPAFTINLSIRSDQNAGNKSPKTASGKANAATAGAKIVVTRSNDSEFATSPARVELNGETFAYLRLAEFHEAVLQAGSMVVSVTGAAGPGRSTYQFTAERGKNYRLHISPNPEYVWKSEVEARFTGKVNQGPFNITLQSPQP